MRHSAVIAILFVVLLLSSRFTAGQTTPKLNQKTQRFDADPSWEGFNNRVPPKPGQRLRVHQQNAGLQSEVGCPLG